MSLGAPLAEPLSHQHWLLPLRPNLLAQLLGLQLGMAQLEVVLALVIAPGAGGQAAA